jgi:WD40 repeat protein
MAATVRHGVFISYARRDGKAFATDLRERLRTAAPDLRVWQDLVEIEGGTGWWRQIEEALEAVEFLVVVMTDGVLDSEITRREWRYARQQGICVYPVKGPGFEFSDPRLSRWMRKVHCYDLDEQWPTFLDHLRRGCRATRIPFMAPDRPGGFVPRPAEFGELKALLLDPARRDPVAVTTALTGAGGFGKTTLACALCHDDDVNLAFDDGILWTTLGEQANVADALAKLYAGLTGERPAFKDAEDAATSLAEKLEHKNCLIVIDDVWNPDDLKPFLRGGAGCARLITTRIAEVAGEAKAKRVTVDEMTSDQAVEMLVARLGTRPARLDPFQALGRRLGEWPLLLKLAAAAIAQRIERGDTLERAVAYVNTAVHRDGVTAFDRRSDADRHAAVAATVGASTKLLAADERQRYAELAVFPEDEAIPLPVVADLWACDEYEAERLVERLANASLVEFDLRTGTVLLHDVLRAYLGETLGASGLVQAHAKLVDRWGDPGSLPHAYAWHWIGYHLGGAGRGQALRELLVDPDWLRAKLEATDIDGLLREFDHASDAPQVRLVRDTLRLSSHVLAKSKSNLAQQLLGRIPETEWSLRDSILQRAAASRECWLRPLRPSLTPPGGPLLRTLEGHAGGINAVALTPDGKRAVSASNDSTLKLWDLERGRELRALEGHSGAVRAVALTSDGKRALSGSDDRTLRLWDLETGRERRTLAGHARGVNAVGLTPDGQRAVSASTDRTLKLWDLGSGQELRTLEGHSGWVRAVALTPDGNRAVSASEDRTLKLWDLESGRELRTFEGHADGVAAVALTPDGQRALSASNDGTLKLWDLESGRELRTLEGHADWVTAVAVTPDGRRAVSTSDDRTLKLWDLESGRELWTLEDHAHGVAAVALTPDGRRAVSASEDRTLKLWDLDSARELRAREGHIGWVRVVAPTPDGKRAVSAGTDRTLKVWDLESGRELRTIKGHAGAVRAVAPTPDGKRAVSASADRTLKLWDLESGRELRTLEGHAGAVRAIALTPDGKHALWAGNDGTLRLWDLESGRELRTLEGHVHGVTAVAVTPDGQRAVSASDDRTLKFWDLESGRELRTLEGETDWVAAIALAPDGKRAVAASFDGALKLWDLESGRELRTFEEHARGVYAVALTPDGMCVVSGGQDRRMAIRELETGALVASFGGDSAISACAVSPDGLNFIAGDAQGRVHFLRLENSTLQRTRDR